MGASGFRGAQRGEFVADVWMAQLDNPLGPRQIPDRMRAEFSQPGFVRKSVQYQIGCGARQHGLSAVREVANTRGAVDRRPDVVGLVAQLDFAGVQPDAQPDRGQRRTLQIERARHRVTRAPERDDEAVALTLLDGSHAAVGTDHFGQSAVESAEGGGHLLGLGLPQPRRPLDVRQQQRHRSGGYQLAHAQVAPVQHGCVNFAHANQPAAIATDKHQRRRVDSPPRYAYLGA